MFNRHQPAWFVRLASKLLIRNYKVYLLLRRMLGSTYGHAVNSSHVYRITSGMLDVYRANLKSSPLRTCIEFGVGSSLLSGLFLREAGFDKVYLIDSSGYASLDPVLYNQAIRDYGIKAVTPFRGKIYQQRQITSWLESNGIHYLDGGLLSLRDVPDKSISFIFSNAVLEHVSRRQIHLILLEFYRILLPGALTIHQVDFRDHMCGSLNHYRFPGWLWESFLVRGTPAYLNRLSACEIRELFSDCGFYLLSENRATWNSIPLSRSSMATPFRCLPSEVLKTYSACFVFSRSYD